MINAEPFAYRQISDDFGGINFFPYLPLTLSCGNNSIETKNDLPSTLSSSKAAKESVSQTCL